MSGGHAIADLPIKDTPAMRLMAYELTPRIPTTPGVADYTDDQLATMNFEQLSNLSDLTSAALRYRVNQLGMSRRGAITRPVTTRLIDRHYQLAAQFGIKVATLKTRIRRNPQLSDEECARLTGNGRAAVVSV